MQFRSTQQVEDDAEGEMKKCFESTSAPPGGNEICCHNGNSNDDGRGLVYGHGDRALALFRTQYTDLRDKGL
jgi:hypothetical protein